MAWVFNRQDAIPVAQPTVSKQLKAMIPTGKNNHLPHPYQSPK